MTYATQADIVATYGDHALASADRDGDGLPDTPAVEGALAWAAATIDSYLSRQYPLPLAAVPSDISGAAIDLALYRLAQTADVLTEELVIRHKDALSRLQEYARGTARLPEGAVDTGLIGEGALEGPRPIVGTGPERLFTRTDLRDL